MSLTCHGDIQKYIPSAIYLNEGLFRTYSAFHVTSETIQPIAGLKPHIPAVVYTQELASPNDGEWSSLPHKRISVMIHGIKSKKENKQNGGADI